MSLRFCGSKHKLWWSQFCEHLPPHSFSENSFKNQLLDNLPRPQFSQYISQGERDFKYSCLPHLKDVENRLPDHTLTELEKFLNVGQNFITKNFVKFCPKAENFNNTDLALQLQSPSVLRKWLQHTCDVCNQHLLIRKIPQCSK